MSDSKPILSAEDIAAGWVAHDGKRQPVDGEIFVEARTRTGHRKTARADYWRLQWESDLIAAYRIVQSIAEKVEEVREAYTPEREALLAAMRDPNEAMIQRDEPKPATCKPTLQVQRIPRSPLLTVAPIPKNGFSLWGAQ